VLLDRTVLPYPDRGVHDLVGIDNRRAGFRITEHLLRLGSRRIAFVAIENAAATVEAREAGYREALFTWGSPIRPEFVHRLDPTSAPDVQRIMKSTRPDAIVCANDWTAARLMHTILGLGYAVPDAVRLVGIDDLEYASLLPVPLTTLRQPTRAIGATAFAAMLDRVTRPDTPVRDILLQTELVVRRSCGASIKAGDQTQSRD
ncbi:MAG: substrate-binding domain-containing protein, partial [Acidobacteria bacterium]|nr:substrate-binding domain-containing protein [Acidobacteriota bacterium]